MTQINLQIGHKVRTKRRKLGVTQVDLSKRFRIISVNLFIDFNEFRNEIWGSIF